ncbi:MAG: serine hydrolase [Thermoanaerobaculia bacterium]
MTPRRLPAAGPSLVPCSLSRVLSSALVIAGIAAAAPAPAAPPPLLPEETVGALAAEVSGTNARHTVQELSLHHRMRGSRGFAAAAEAIRSRAEAYGLDGVEVLELPADGERVYGTQRSRPAWDADFAELWELASEGEGSEGEDRWADARRIASYDLRPVTLAQDSASGSAVADLVDVGTGTAPEDYAGEDVAGKLVLASAQPEDVAPLAVAEHGAAGIVSWAQNQKSAWWGRDETLVRWGHLDTFPETAAEAEAFAFMVSPAQAAAWRERLERGERVRLRAEVRAGRHPGAYRIPMATIPGADPELTRQEIVYSCHLDHQRPGANDDASGCAAILEAARALAKLVEEGKLAAPRRTLRFVWPPEIEGTIALLVARPDLAARARAVIHLDMVGGDAGATKAVFHVTRSPASLPTVANDVAEAFARWVNEETYAYAATGEGSAVLPDALVDPEGSREPLRARIAPFSMGSDHQVWAEGSFRVPAIYMNDWPDRFIHTHADSVANVDPTKLRRAAFLAAASGYTLASLDGEDVPGLLEIVRRHALERTARTLERSAELAPEEAENLLRHHLAAEGEIVRSVARFAPPPPAAMEEAGRFLERLEALVELPLDADGGGGAGSAGEDGAGGRLCARVPEPVGPLRGFGYSYLDDRLADLGRAAPELLSYRGRWGGGEEYAYEVLNLLDGRRTLGAVRDAVAATYGPVPLDLVAGFVDALEAIGLVTCDPDVLDWAGAPTAPVAERAPRFPPPEDPMELAAAGFAKVLCSAVWVSGREPEDAAEESGFIMAPAGRAGEIEWTVDRERREARATAPTAAGPVTRTARFHGDQGCTLLPADLPGGGGEVHFEPVPVESDLPPADETPWPMGDRLPDEPLPSGVDRERLATAVDAAFADPEAHTVAFLAVHRGRIVAERYAEERGVGPETQLESWSMGKSLTATLVGRLIQEGAFGLHDPAPVPAWREPGDPRGAITVADLLRMSSGLHCVAPRDPDYSAARGYPDHMYIYSGAVDIFDFATSRPLQFPPGTEGRYRNCDPLTLGYLVREEARRWGEEYLAFPQRLLFDRIGIRRQVLEVDPYGNFSLTGFDYGTARNWARLGLLYLNDGVWSGGGSEERPGEGPRGGPGGDRPERLLPEGFARFVASPAPAWKEPVYGGLFWLNLAGTLALPRDAFYMAGAGGQYTIVVPSLDLVVVRMGHLRGLPRALPALNRALEELTAALGP